MIKEIVEPEMMQASCQTNAGKNGWKTRHRAVTFYNVFSV